MDTKRDECNWEEGLLPSYLPCFQIGFSRNFYIHEPGAPPPEESQNAHPLPLKRPKKPQKAQKAPPWTFGLAHVWCKTVDGCNKVRATENIVKTTIVAYGS